jgi:hypothetical protein
MRRVLLVCVAILALPASVFAQNATTIGTLTLTPTFDNIGVKLTYTGDANSNNSATLQFRVQGSGTWLDAHTASISTTAHWPDRRSTVTGASNAANQNQFRASIVGLGSGAIYDIQLTLSDADGVTGTNPVTGTVTMLSTSTLAPQSGSTKYLDTNAAGGGDGSSGTPYNTWANAQTGTACGDTLIIKSTSGSSAGVTFSKSCANSNWYQIQCADQSVIAFAEGAGTTPNLTISGDSVKVENCRFGTSSDGNLTLTSTPTDVWLDNLYLVDSGTDTVAAECSNTPRYGEAAIQIDSGALRITITGGSMLSPTLKATAECATAWNSSFFGIGFPSAGAAANRIIIRGVTIDGGWRDCIGGAPEDGTSHFDDSDIANNTITGCKDDHMQLEASDINLRVWGNVMTATTGWSCIAMQSGFFGPMYVYRNYCLYSSSHGGAGYKIGGTEGPYFFHNTFKITSSGTDCWGDSLGSANHSIYLTARNNICQSATGNMLAGIYSTGTTFDYDVLYAIGNDVVYHWNGVTIYNTVALFCSGASQECNGKGTNPNLDGSLHIGSGSNAYNAGVSLANFNDASSAWPAANGAPDIGVYEVSSLAGKRRLRIRGD